MQVGDKIVTRLTSTPLELQKAYDPEQPWVELGGDEGAWISTVAAGVVTHVGPPQEGIDVQGDDGTTYVYGHVQAPIVHEQQRVTEGRTLAQIALDPGQRAHVRFAVLSLVAPGTSRPVDPTPYVAPEPTTFKDGDVVRQLERFQVPGPQTGGEEAPRAPRARRARTRKPV